MKSESHFWNLYLYCWRW